MVKGARLFFFRFSHPPATVLYFFGCSPFWVGGHHIGYINLKRLFVAVGSRRKGFPYCFLGYNPAPLFSNLPGGRAGLGGVKRLGVWACLNKINKLGPD